MGFNEPPPRHRRLPSLESLVPELTRRGSCRDPSRPVLSSRPSRTSTFRRCVFFFFITLFRGRRRLKERKLVSTAPEPPVQPLLTATNLLLSVLGLLPGVNRKRSPFFLSLVSSSCRPFPSHYYSHFISTFSVVALHNPEFD